MEAAPSAWDSELAKLANWKQKNHVVSLDLSVPGSSDTHADSRVLCHTHARVQPRGTAGSSAAPAARQPSFP